MEIILSRQCESLSGSLGRGFGYVIQRRSDPNGKIRFWGVRKSKGAVPPDGHWRFILCCANLAQNKLHIADIKVSGDELKIALSEACLHTSSLRVDLDYMYNANDVLQLKKQCDL